MLPVKLNLQWNGEALYYSEIMFVTVCVHFLNN